MPADSRPAGFAATVRGLRSPSPAAVADNDFGRGSRPWRSPNLDLRAMARQATARFTDGLSGWLRSALPGVVIDAPDEQRGRRDRVADAAIYLVAFAISAFTLAGSWERQPPWLRVVAVVVGIGALVSLHWRRAQGDRAADEARAAERRRIAREMHDVLAHRLSLLSVHAGALEFHPDAPAEEVAEAAGVIRESAKTALEELRGVIGVLREDGDESLTQPPQPTLADLAALVEESRAAGMRVTARIELGDAAPPAAVGPTAYRIAQEGLTNARKHAPGAAVTLSVRAPDGDLQVEVRSLAPVAVAAAAPLPGAGTGLIGLAERVSLAGGTLEHGVDPDGAFVLRARLPR